MLWKQLVHNVVGRADGLVDQRPLQCYHVFPLDVVGREHHLELLQVRDFETFKLLVLGRTLPGLVLFPSEGILGGSVLEELFDPVVAMVGPEVLALFAVVCVHQDVIGDPVLADEGAGQGFHQADSIVQRAFGVDGDAQGPVGADPGIFPFDFPRRKAGHVNMPLA